MRHGPRSGGELKGNSEGFPFCQSLLHVKAGAIVFHRKLQNSIGGSQGNVYMGGPGVLPDVVKAFLH